jgi:hypothetical protein
VNGDGDSDGVARTWERPMSFQTACWARSLPLPGLGTWQLDALTVPESTSFFFSLLSVHTVHTVTYVPFPCLHLDTYVHIYGLGKDEEPRNATDERLTTYSA